MIIKHPLPTEKAVRLMESENTMVFVVDSSANKHKIAKEVEKMFKVKVKKVRIANYGGLKKAYVKLKDESNALDIATELGMI